MRYLLIDRILEFECSRRVVAVKNVTLESDVLADHFPGFPLFPGALTLESMAQAAGYLLIRSALETTGQTVAAALTAVERAQFRRPVRPGDQVRVTVELVASTPNVAQVIALTAVEGQTTGKARLVLGQRALDGDVHPELVQAMRRLFRSLERSEGLL